jgi:hypothetical protein
MYHGEREREAQAASIQHAGMNKDEEEDQE